MQDTELQNKTSPFIVPTLFILLIWGIYAMEIKYGFNLNKYGIFPRTIEGLRGIVFTHFLHTNTGHLFNNSIPLFVLLSGLFYFYKDIAFKILIIGGLLTGFAIWLIARDSYHIGASGIVYLLFSSVFFSGIIRKHYRLVALSFIVIFLYGSMIWYVFPIKDGMSWEGHLSGFLVGLVLAFIYRKNGLVRKDYEFSTTEFDLLFDENGNLIQPEESKENLDVID
ncbi:MAG: rhomboid family intramembrane serine protease [Polaribacter sp.]|jgi:membrane associated rhomboid family serine protease